MASLFCPTVRSSTPQPYRMFATVDTVKQLTYNLTKGCVFPPPIFPLATVANAPNLSYTYLTFSLEGFNRKWPPLRVKFVNRADWMDREGLGMVSDRPCRAISHLRKGRTLFMYIDTSEIQSESLPINYLAIMSS